MPTNHFALCDSEIYIAVLVSLQKLIFVWISYVNVHRKKIDKKPGERDA